MTPTEFQPAWHALAHLESVPETLREKFAALSTIAAASLVHVRLSEPDRELLTQVGLPETAAPFLSFGRYVDFLDLSRSDERIGPLVEGLVQIGSDGAGNPICLEAATGDVVLVDHDHEFGRQFVNSSVLQLAESLVVYGRLRGDVGRWTNQIRGFDPAALAPATFWHFEAESDSPN